jgi:hypothetical protein
VRLGDGRVRLVGRSTGERVWLHDRDTEGVWSESNRGVGTGVLSSGPAAAASTDGKLVHVFGRGMNHRIWAHLPNADEVVGVADLHQRVARDEARALPPAAAGRSATRTTVAGTWTPRLGHFPLRNILDGLIRLNTRP